MAIQFARCEYVSRSSGANACRKASYNQREVIRCERTGELFSFKERGGNVHHEILLPVGADEKFKNSTVLWNEAENCEKRKDSQVAKEFVIALPDDKEITLEDRIVLTRRFGNIFVERGLAVQLDVHAPHEGEKNWHAHLLVTTRRFSEDGLSFFSKKATDLDPVIRSGTVVEGELWGEVWRDLQNDYFKEKGYEIRVDPIGCVPQEHLGPVRMRQHLNEAVLRAELLQKANEVIAQSPLSILEELTRTKSFFSKEDVDHFLRKHVPINEREGLLEKVLDHSNVVPLYDKESQEKSSYFTTHEVRAEEEKLVRFTDAIANKSSASLSRFSIEKGLEGKSLSTEQQKAYDLCVSGENLSVIQGRAGVGKSYVLDAIRTAHEEEGYRVLGLAPTHKVAVDLKNGGFKEAKTCHSFLFAFKNDREHLNSKTLVIVDEAGMLGTTLSVELFHVLKKSGSKVILVGDDRQLSSVERGGAFSFLAERYKSQSVELHEVRRQTTLWQKETSEALSENHVTKAADLLEENKAITWTNTKDESLVSLLKDWGKEGFLNPTASRLILAQRNIDVDALNQGARDILRQQGKLGDLEIICSTNRGRCAFAEGDRIQLTETDKGQGLLNGSFGVIDKINPTTKAITVRFDNEEVKDIDPHTYSGFRHGYAATIYKSQGSTLDHVYVLHSRITNRFINYVALTRQTKSLSLYVSKEETPSKAHLIAQMSQQEIKGLSLAFATEQELEKEKEAPSFSKKIKDTAERMMTKVSDFFHKNEDFYNLKFHQAKTTPQEPEIHSAVKDREGHLDSVINPKSHSEKANDLQQSQQLHQSSRFLEKEKNKGNPASPQIVSASFERVKAVENALRQNMSAFADHVFSSLGEDYNRAHSSKTERRYGKKGALAVNVKTGAWIDYRDSSLSGGPLQMLTKLKGFSFQEAVDYGTSWAGLEKTSHKDKINVVENKRVLENPLHKERKTHENTDTAKEERERVQKAQQLWNKGRAVQGTLAEEYLNKRGIKGPWPQDIRYLSSFKDHSSGQEFPCLMAAARSVDGEIRAVQLTFLDPETAGKADIPIQKKSFGVLKGSFVTLQKGLEGDPVFVAEGLETALSLKQAKIPGTIKASLGLSNIKRLEPKDPTTPIVICADHDAPDSQATKSLGKTVFSLQERGVKVTVIKPDNLSDDFNDVLKKGGAQKVRESIEKAMGWSKAKQDEKDFTFKDNPVSYPNKRDNLEQERSEYRKSYELAKLKQSTLYNENYLRFKALGREIENTEKPSHRLQEERQTLGLSLAQNKQWLMNLKQYDAQQAHLIEKMGREHEKQKQISLDRGGLSL